MIGEDVFSNATIHPHVCGIGVSRENPRCNDGSTRRVVNAREACGRVGISFDFIIESDSPANNQIIPTRSNPRISTREHVVILRVTHGAIVLSSDNSVVA